MLRKLLFLLIVVIVWEGIQSPCAVAQKQNPCITPTTWWFSDPIPFGWFSWTPYPGALVFVIAAHNSNPNCNPAPEGPCPGCPSAASGTSGGSGGSGGSPNGPSSAPASSTPHGQKPIYFATGDTYIDQTDANLPGLGGGLHLTRRWNSIWPSNEIASSIGIFGANWRSTYEEKIFMGGDNYLKYSRGDGTYWSFGLSSFGTFVAVSPARAAATLTQTASAWLLSFPNGEKRSFSLTTGMLTSIVDRNGNTIQVSYDTYGRLATITDPAGRHLYFNYPNGSSFLVSSVTSDFGLTVSYTYDSNNRLSQVTRPDNSTLNFTYNSASQITQVTDSNGKVIEAHTYDSSGRGLTASQANGVNQLTITYPY